jgi:hypothetical protein
VTDLDHRQLGRDSLFLMADLRFAQGEGEHKVKVLNLSAGGMMAEAAMKVTRGAPVQVNLRNIGWVDGVVAWIQDNRFGIAFVEDIDPKSARAPVNSVATGGESGTPRYVKPPLGQYEAGRLRKI